MHHFQMVLIFRGTRSMPGTTPLQTGVPTDAAPAVVRGRAALEVELPPEEAATLDATILALRAA